MGSQIVDAIVTQIGSIETNPTPAPGSSQPIEQFPFPLIKSYQPIEQKPPLETAEVDGVPTSNPIEQAFPGSFGLIGPGEVDQDFSGNMEQFITASENLKSVGDPQYDLTLELRAFRTKTVGEEPDPADVSFLVQQFLTETAESRPVEQTEEVTNTVDITQFDFIDLIFPPCNSIKNPTETDILWRIKDFGFDYNTETLVFRVNGVPVQDDPTFIITAIAGGLQLDFDPPEDFPFESEVQIFLEIEDTADPPNAFIFRCKWDTVPDTLAPIVSNMTVCNSSDVSVQAPIEFDILDRGFGVDPNSIRLSIEGITVCSGITLEDIAVPGSGTGFHVTHVHPDDPFRFGAFITVGVTAQDLSPQQNSSLFLCFFETEESESPVFVNFDPEPCETFVDNITGLDFEVYGVEDGIDISTLEVRVDNKLRKVFVRPRILRSQ